MAKNTSQGSGAKSGVPRSPGPIPGLASVSAERLALLENTIENEGLSPADAEASPGVGPGDLGTPDLASDPCEVVLAMTSRKK